MANESQRQNFPYWHVLNFAIFSVLAALIFATIFLYNFKKLVALKKVVIDICSFRIHTELYESQFNYFSGA